MIKVLMIDDNKELIKALCNYFNIKKDIIISDQFYNGKDAIDYIIIHEFCHLVHMNHSKDFYNLVKCIMPNYKVANNWLRENGYKLIL